MLLHPPDGAVRRPREGGVERVHGVVLDGDDARREEGRVAHERFEHLMMNETRG